MSYPGPTQPSLLARALIPLGVVILVAVAAAIYLFYLQGSAPKTLKNPLAPPTIPPVSATSGLSIPPLTPANPAGTETATAVDTATSPALEHIKIQGHKSNEDVLADVSSLNVDGLAKLLVREEFTRKLAIAIYGLSEGRVANQNRPLVSPDGAFAVSQLGEEPNVQYKVLAQNANRYDHYVAALAALDSAPAVAVYARTYPLLQAGFEELGVGRRSFHQIVILAIDNLLAAPDAAEGAILIPSKMKYVYQDPQLEKLPATHKLMLRLGPQHNQTVKQHLRSLRQKLVELNF